MRELSLHILDIVTNSIEADATRILVHVRESQRQDQLLIRIRDNGRGMSEEMVRRVSDPFVTTRKTRAVGMGISLIKQAALQARGDVQIRSQLGKGTQIEIKFKLHCLNRLPMGNMVETVINLIVGTPDVHFVYIHENDEKRFVFDSFWVLARMHETDCSFFKAVQKAREYLIENLKQIQQVD